jgi:hypothetical protein
MHTTKPTPTGQLGGRPPSPPVACSSPRRRTPSMERVDGLGRRTQAGEAQPPRRGRTVLVAQRAPIEGGSLVWGRKRFAPRQFTHRGGNVLHASSHLVTMQVASGLGCRHRHHASRARMASPRILWDGSAPVLRTAAQQGEAELSKDTKVVLGEAGALMHLLWWLQHVMSGVARALLHTRSF